MEAICCFLPSGRGENTLRKSTGREAGAGDVGVCVLLYAALVVVEISESRSPKGKAGLVCDAILGPRP